MMKRLFIIVLLTGMAFLPFSNYVYAQEQKEAEKKELKTAIVRVQGYEGVSPLNLMIEPGTVVVWINQFQQAAIEVKFPEKKVTLACQSPVNFSLSKEGTYVSNPIPYGAVASLCFIEQGSFDYFIERSAPRATISPKSADQFKFEGKIIVKAK